MRAIAIVMVFVLGCGGDARPRQTPEAAFQEVVTAVLAGDGDAVWARVNPSNVEMLEVLARGKPESARDKFLASFAAMVPVAPGATAPPVERVEREGAYAIIHFRGNTGAACRAVLVEDEDGRWLLELGVGLLAPKPGCDPA